MSELFEAIRTGDIARVTAMIDADPAILEAEENGVSTLMTAIYNGRQDVAKFLLDKGKKLTFHEACAVGDLARVQKMVRENPVMIDAKSADGFPPAGLAIFFRQPAVARFLIESGADVNAHADNAQRVACVHAAAAVCDRDIMRLLLDRGADPNARQQMDYTPLHSAASRGDVEMAKLLIAHGADPAARASDGLTAGDVARTHGKPEFASWFETQLPR